MQIFDVLVSDYVCTVFGHSGSSFLFSFTLNCRHHITASADSCVYIWRLPLPLVLRNALSGVDAWSLPANKLNRSDSNQVYVSARPLIQS